MEKNRWEPFTDEELDSLWFGMRVADGESMLNSDDRIILDELAAEVNRRVEAKKNV